MHTPCMYFPTLLRPHTSLIFLFLPPAVAKGGGETAGEEEEDVWAPFLRPREKCLRSKPVDNYRCDDTRLFPSLLFSPHSWQGYKIHQKTCHILSFKIYFWQLSTFWNCSKKSQIKSLVWQILHQKKKKAILSVGRTGGTKRKDGDKSSDNWAEKREMRGNHCVGHFFKKTWCQEIVVLQKSGSLWVIGW